MRITKVKKNNNEAFFILQRNSHEVSDLVCWAVGRGGGLSLQEVKHLIRDSF